MLDHKSLPLVKPIPVYAGKFSTCENWHDTICAEIVPWTFLV